MRLTKKELMSAINQPMCFGSRLVGKQMFAQIIKELCEYKTIEEELGIDLVTLSKALQQDSIWVREHNTKEQEIVYERVRLNYLNHTLDFVEPRKEIGKGRNLFDYGESWALTKEELL